MFEVMVSGVKDSPIKAPFESPVARKPALCVQMTQ